MIGKRNGRKCGVETMVSVAAVVYVCMRQSLNLTRHTASGRKDQYGYLISQPVGKDKHKHRVIIDASECGNIVRCISCIYALRRTYAHAQMRFYTFDREVVINDGFIDLKAQKDLAKRKEDEHNARKRNPTATKPKKSPSSKKREKKADAWVPWTVNATFVEAFYKGVPYVLVVSLTDIPAGKYTSPSLLPTLPTYLPTSPVLAILLHSSNNKITITQGKKY
jgi:hypothetical protein